MSGKKVLIVSPGFIGWNVLDILVAEGYEVRGLVRRKEHAEGIEKSGTNAVLSDLDDRKLITDETAKSDLSVTTSI